MTRFLGVDLAWGEGSATKQANESGLACVDENGRVLDAGWARGTDAVVRWIERMWEPGAVLAIDAPLVVDNPSGMRLCERETGSRYGRWHVAANASNLGLPWLAGVAVRRRLEAAGWTYTDGLSAVPPRASSSATRTRPWSARRSWATPTGVPGTNAWAPRFRSGNAAPSGRSSAMT
ncbi:hypothetical protein [Cryobacterium shii]|uniref:hypothetical protein n=1 Tax=Cryobacterium shii TaxID=1259235 RepID=UPI001FCBCBBC|nr:hypothetical protein [Cryobacterium shii]